MRGGVRGIKDDLACYLPHLFYVCVCACVNVDVGMGVLGRDSVCDAHCEVRTLVLISTRTSRPLEKELSTFNVPLVLFYYLEKGTEY